MAALHGRWVAAVVTPLLASAACLAQEPDDDPPEGVPGAQHPEFDEARAWSHLELQVGLGPRVAGSKELEKLRVHLEKELESYGLTPRRDSFREDTPVGAIDFHNVWADLESPLSPPGEAPLVIVGTHIDTKRIENFVGANDGGSGTAALLELARVIAKGPPRPVAYRFLFLDGEEATRSFWRDKDHTYGSRYHATQLKKGADFKRTKAFVLLDLVGDKDLVLADERYSTDWLRRLFFDAAKDVGLGKHVEGAVEYLKDDHQEFLAVGIPSVDLIDFDYGPNNDWWHTTEDTLDKCSKESLGVIGRIVLAGLTKLEERVGPK